MLWQLLRGTEAIDGHCGYDFSWAPWRALPFAASAEYHDFHHSSNTGNYSTFFTLWDSVLGTNSTYYEYIKTKESKETLKDKTL